MLESSFFKAAIMEIVTTRKNGRVLVYKMIKYVSLDTMW